MSSDDENVMELNEEDDAESVTEPQPKPRKKARSRKGAVAGNSEDDAGDTENDSNNREFKVYKTPRGKWQVEKDTSPVPEEDMSEEEDAPKKPTCPDRHKGNTYERLVNKGLEPTDPGYKRYNVLVRKHTEEGTLEEFKNSPEYLQASEEFQRLSEETKVLVKKWSKDYPKISNKQILVKNARRRRTLARKKLAFAAHRIKQDTLVSRAEKLIHHGGGGDMMAVNGSGYLSPIKVMMELFKMRTSLTEGIDVQMNNVIKSMGITLEEDKIVSIIAD